MVRTANAAAIDSKDQGRNRRVSRPFASAVAVSGLILLTGCSSLPDALNPVEWYEGATDTVGGWFSDDEASAEAPRTPAEGDFPNLASVPERPVPSTTEQEREGLTRGLIADRDNARYTDSASATAPASAPSTATATAIAQSTAPSSVAATGAASSATPTVASPPPPPPAVVSSGDGSTLWPRRPVPETRLSTTTAARVGGGTTVRQPEGGVRIQTPVAGGGRAASVTPPAPAEQQAAVRVETPPSRTTQLDAAAAGSATGGSTAVTSAPAPSAADETPSVIVDGPTLDQYQLGFSGPAYLVGTVYFAHGSASLTAEERGLIAQIAGAALETDAAVRVIGHASARTAEMPLDRHELANFNVSLARAEAVAQALARNGVPEGRVLIEAMSASQPLFFESMPSGEAGNRRAEILLQY